MRPTLNQTDPYHPDPLIRGLHGLIRIAVRLLAVLMAIVIILGVVDVIYVLYDRLFWREPYYVLEITDIFDTFGTFMAVLIGIEIFVNIVLYLRHDVIHVRLVIATALMAIARKVIILDFAATSGVEAVGLGMVLLATSGAFWVVYSISPATGDPPHL